MRAMSAPRGHGRLRSFRSRSGERRTRVLLLQVRRGLGEAQRGAMCRTRSFGGGHNDALAAVGFAGQVALLPEMRQDCSVGSR